MKDFNNSYVLVVIWQWNNGEDKIGKKGTKKYDVWKTQEGHVLIRTAQERSDGSNLFLHRIVEPYLLKGYHAIIMLHESYPHSYRDEDCNKLKNTFGRHITLVRVRLFGNGRGPVYFNSRENPLGILGKNGSFPYIRNEHTGQEIQTFVLDREEKKIDSRFFKFVWNYYWHAPRHLMNDLANRFQYWAVMGFDAQQQEQNLADYLRSEPLMWGRLKTLVEMEQDEQESFIEETSEYDMTSYQSYLRAVGKEEIAQQIQAIKTDIRSDLDTVHSTTDPQETICRICNNLYSLAKSVPINLH